MKKYLATMRILSFLGCGAVSASNAESTPPDHAVFDRLLKRYVDDYGLVDYKSLKENRDELDAYLSILEANAPSDSWTTNERLAYWINAYNAFTLDLIVEFYPVSSIKDIGAIIQIPFINTPWDIKFIKIGEEIYDLNNIEHGIIRREFDEPRIHFALVCAAMSCPRLRNEAYEAIRLEEQLSNAAREFLADTAKNRFINSAEAELSKIFLWYGGDFKEEQSLISFLNTYAPIQLAEDASLDYLDYSWELNEQ